jgi:hypothetical protein
MEQHSRPGHEISHHAACMLYPTRSCERQDKDGWQRCGSDKYEREDSNGDKQDALCASCLSDDVMQALHGQLALLRQ